MKAIIMAGGKGQRLRPLTDSQPKPLVPVCGEAVLIRILRWLRQNGITEAVIASGCFRQQTEALCGAECEGIRLHYTEERTPLGTAGSVKAAETHLRDGDFFVLSGDALCEFDLKRALSFHREKHAEVTMLLTGAEDPTEYGMVLTEPDGRVIRFIEKPDVSQAFTDTVNTGIYLLSPRVLEDIPEGIPMDFGHELFPQLVRRGRRVYGLADNGYWSDIGSPEAYLAANLRYAAAQRKDFQAAAARGDTKAPQAAENPPCDLPAGCTNSVIGKGCRIGAGAEITDSVLMDGAAVGSGSIVRSAILCRNSAVGRDCRIAERVVLGEGVLLGDRVSAGSGVRLGKGARIASDTVLGAASETNAATVGRLFSNGVFAGPSDLLTPEFCRRIGKSAALALKKDGSGKPRIGVMHAGGGRMSCAKTAGEAIARGIVQGGGISVSLGAGFRCAAASAAPALSLDSVFFVRSDCCGNTSVTLTDRFGLRPGRLTERPMLAFLRQPSDPAEEQNTPANETGERNTPAAAHDPSEEPVSVFSLHKTDRSYLASDYGPALREAAGNLAGVRISVAAHRNTAAASASGVLAGVLTEAGADISEDAPLGIDMDEDGGNVRLTEGATEADLSHILAILLVARPELFCEPLAFSCRDSEEVFRIAVRLGYDCGRYASCPSDGEDDRMREAAAGNPILRDASLAVLALLRLQKETGETLAGLSALLPPFVRRTERIPAPGVRASAVRRLGDPDGDGVYRAAEGGGVRVIPEATGYRLIAEAYSAEYAEELLSETEQKLKTLLRE